MEMNISPWPFGEVGFRRRTVCGRRVFEISLFHKLLTGEKPSSPASRPRIRIECQHLKKKSGIDENKIRKCRKYFIDSDDADSGRAWREDFTGGEKKSGAVRAGGI